MVRKPLTEMCHLVADPSFRNKKDDLLVKENLIYCLETLIGCCQATRTNNLSILFDIVEPSLQSTISLLGGFTVHKVDTVHGLIEYLVIVY